MMKQNKNAYTFSKITKAKALLAITMICIFSWLESSALADTSQSLVMGNNNDFHGAITNKQEVNYYNGIDYSKKFQNNPSKVNYIPRLAKYHSLKKKRKEFYELSRKLNVLEEDENIVTFYIAGISGSGKTELAKSYAHEHENKYSFVIVFNAGDKKEFQGKFESLARSINPTEFYERISSIDGEDTEKIKKDTIRFILENLKKRDDRWLWIFDNVKDYDQIEDCIPDIKGVKGTVIVTTQKRHSDIDDGERVDLNKGMDKEESVELLYKVVGKNIDKNILGTKEDAFNLVEELDRLPLAISAIGFYINIEKSKRPNSLVTFNKVIKRLRDEMERGGLGDELEELENCSHKKIKCKFAQIAAISLLIKQLSKEELVILELCEFINTNHIPRWLLEEHLRFKLPNLKFSEYKLEELVEEHPLLSLESYGKKDSDDDLFFIHRETQVQAKRLIINDEESSVADIILAMVSIMNEDHHYLKQIMAEKMKILYPHFISLVDYLISSEGGLSFDKYLSREAQRKIIDFCLDITKKIYSKVQYRSETKHTNRENILNIALNIASKIQYKIDEVYRALFYCYINTRQFKKIESVPFQHIRRNIIDHASYLLYKVVGSFARMDVCPLIYRGTVESLELVKELYRRALDENSHESSPFLDDKEVLDIYLSLSEIYLYGSAFKYASTTLVSGFVKARKCGEV